MLLVLHLLHGLLRARGRYRRGVAVLGIESDELRAEERHDRHGDDVGREQRQHHGQRKRGEEVFTDTGQQHHGEEDDAGGACGGENSELHLGAPIACGFDGIFAELHVAEDVFEYDDGVID